VNSGWSSAYRLSAPEFVTCWDRLGLGELPLALELRRPGATADARAASYRQEGASLTARGLADARGRPHPGLAETLQLVAGPSFDCDLRCTGGLAPGLSIGLGSVRGRSGVVTLRHGERIAVRPTDGARVAATLVELAGPLRASRGCPANIPATDFDVAFAGAPDHWAAADRLVARGVARAEADSVARMLRGITSGGQLGATAWVAGCHRRGDWVIGYHRAPGGACAQLRRPAGRHVVETVTITPTTAAQLLGLVEELIRATASV
jgi:hypothetical protein